MNSKEEDKIPIENKEKAVDFNANKEEKKKMSREDFEKIRFLGAGSYANVFLVKHKQTEKLYAMKVILKSRMHKEKKEEEVKTERDVLACTRHPNIIRLSYTFRDKKRLYFVIEYASNGSLADLLEVYTKFPLPLIKHYTAELITTLEYLHSKGIAHRDLKPANIMLDEHFHIKLGDFGTAKFMTDKIISGQVVNHKGYAFVGSPEYVSPEILANEESGPASDLWALGCIVYQFFTGITPFTDKAEYLIFQAILKGEFKIPKEVPESAAKLIKQLLVVDPSQRLGSGLKDSPLSYEALKRHEFFEGVNFEELGKQEVKIDKDKIIKLQEKKKVEMDDEESFEESTKAESIKAESTKADTEPKILKEGIISQKPGLFFYNKRKVVLTSKPELICYELDKKVNKEKIILSRTVNIIVSKKKFQVKIGKTTYKFEGATQSETEEWVKSIKEAIDTYCPK